MLLSGATVKKNPEKYDGGKHGDLFADGE